MAIKQREDNMQKGPIRTKGKRRTVDLVTGATSGVGKILLSELMSKGHEVRVIVKEHPNKSSNWASLPAGVKPYTADIRLNDQKDEKELISACKGADNLFHVAGASYNHNNTYNQLIDTNVIATENVLNAFVKSNPKVRNLHFIYVSSVTVYGYRRKDGILTEDSELKPKSKYSESKILAEQVIKSFASTNKNLKYTIIRFGTFYGTHYKESFFKVFKLIQDGRMVYIDHGLNHLTLINVNDVVNALILALNDTKSDIYNVVENPYTVKELTEFIAKNLKVNKPKLSVPYVVGKMTRKMANVNIDEFEFMTSNRIVSINKIKKNLGFKIKYHIKKEGLELLNEFIQKRKKAV